MTNPTARALIVGVVAVALAATGPAAAGSASRGTPTDSLLAEQLLRKVVEPSGPRATRAGLAWTPASPTSPAPQGHGVTFPGLALCEGGSAKYYPVYSTGHDLTVTRAHVFTANSPDFSNAVDSLSGL